MAKTVLIVEDNELNMKLFHDLIQAHGYNILQTKDGMEALKLARQHKPDLILMDIQLPEMDGLEATRRLKADPVLRDTPVIALTAFAMKGDEETMRAAGCDGYVTKPIRYREFLAEVEGVVARKAG
jgi:two-component system cell cycle response regulator DivK